MIFLQVIQKRSQVPSSLQRMRSEPRYPASHVRVAYSPGTALVTSAVAWRGVRGAPHEAAEAARNETQSQAQASGLQSVSLTKGSSKQQGEGGGKTHGRLCVRERVSARRCVACVCASDASKEVCADWSTRHSVLRARSTFLAMASISSCMYGCMDVWMHERMDRPSPPVSKCRPWQG